MLDALYALDQRVHISRGQGVYFAQSQERERERERAEYPKYYNLLRKAVASIPLKNFKTVDDMLDWWFSGLSEAQWIAAHYHQYKLNI